MLSSLLVIRYVNAWTWPLYPDYFLLTRPTQGSEEDLLVSLSRNTISVVCYEPTTVPLYPICVESDGPCYPKMGDLHYIEWFDPRATFDPEQFATIKLKM